MDFQILKTEKEYQDLLDWVDIQLDLSFDPDTKEGRDLRLALSLIMEYEDLHYPIPSPKK